MARRTIPNSCFGRTRISHENMRNGDRRLSKDLSVLWLRLAYTKLISLINQRIWRFSDCRRVLPRPLGRMKNQRSHDAVAYI